VPASAVIETSPGGNSHSWYFLDRAIGAGDGQELGKLMRQSCGGDHCSGVVTQPFRLPGLVNHPDAKKRKRGRVAVPTRILRLTDRTYGAAQLTAAFACAPLPIEASSTPAPATETHRPAYCRSRARAILRAELGDDRSAAFMSACNYAWTGGMTAEEFETIAREHLDGCAGKYAGRLREEIDRCYSKMGAADTEWQRRRRWHRDLSGDPQLTTDALEFAALIRNDPSNERYIRVQFAAELEAGCRLLIRRKWLIDRDGWFALGRGPSLSVD
jgi:hypothetical protein